MLFINCSRILKPGIKELFRMQGIDIPFVFNDIARVHKKDILHLYDILLHMIKRLGAVQRNDHEYDAVNRKKYTECPIDISNEQQHPDNIDQIGTHIQIQFLVQIPICARTVFAQIKIISFILFRINSLAHIQNIF